MYDVELPKWGMTMQDGTVSEWVKKAGDSVEEGDVIVGVAGRPVADAAALTAAIADLQPGEEVEITLERGGEERTVRATLGSRGVEGDGG